MMTRTAEENEEFLFFDCIFIYSLYSRSKASPLRPIRYNLSNFKQIIIEIRFHLNHRPTMNIKVPILLTTHTKFMVTTHKTQILLKIQNIITKITQFLFILYFYRFKIIFLLNPIIQSHQHMTPIILTHLVKPKSKSMLPLAKLFHITI